jgi:hypothetical protein
MKHADVVRLLALEVPEGGSATSSGEGSLIDCGSGCVMLDMCIHDRLILEI